MAFHNLRSKVDTWFTIQKIRATTCTDRVQGSLNASQLSGPLGHAMDASPWARHHIESAVDLLHSYTPQDRGTSMTKTLGVYDVKSYVEKTPTVSWFRGDL